MATRGKRDNAEDAERAEAAEARRRGGENVDWIERAKKCRFAVRGECRIAKGARIY
jgi:hypothetical protein